MGLRAAELEVLFTANTDQIAKAEQQVKQVGQKIEGKPVTFVADAKGVIASMDRVAAQAKRLVSADTIVKLDADISRVTSGIDRTKGRIEDLRIKAEAGLDIKVEWNRASAQLQKLERSLKGLTDARGKIEVDADVTAALADLAKLRDAERVVSTDVAAKVDLDISYAQKNVTRIQAQLEVLRTSDPSPKVLVDISRAESQLDTAQKKLDHLSSARASMKVDADTSAAESALSQVDSVAERAGAEAGRSFAGSLDAATRGAGEKVGAAVGAGVESTLIEALAAIPVAGGIVLGAVAIGKAITGAIQDGLSVEKSVDRLQALTGISEVDALRLGRAAGEAYASNFGTSIESNMDTTRLALQFRIIDPSATTRDAQQVVQGLSGIADVLGEDVRPVATAVTQLLRTGLASSARDAFDILAAGARNGVNASEDMVDTFTEYPALFQRLGLSGSEALGLINQGLKGGARNSDLAADALKEFQIRATDGSKLSAEGFTALGLSAEEMTAKIAQGGPAAREGLMQVLDGLRQIEDPVARNAAAVALFGTQAEDLGAALLAMDLHTAVEQLDGVSGAAQRMFDTMASNDASKIEQAQRNIEVAAQGIQAALAQAFGEPLADFSDWVSQNRGPMMSFLLDLATGAIDFGIASVNATADSVEGMGHLMGAIAPVVGGLAAIAKAMNLPGASELEATARGLQGFAQSADGVADSMRERMIPALEETKGKLHEALDPAVADAFVNDASVRLTSALEAVGTAADGGRAALEGIDVANLTSTASGKLLADQIRAASTALDEQAAAAGAAGESQQNVTDRYNQGRDALVGQLQAMGMTEQQAWALVNAYGTIPAAHSTSITSNAPEQIVVIDGLAYRVTHLPDGRVALTADTSPAQGAIDSFINRNNGRTVTIYSSVQGQYIQGDGGKQISWANGGIARGVKAFANSGFEPGIYPYRNGGIHKFAEEYDEAYISMNPARRARSEQLVAQIAELFGGMYVPGDSQSFADGGFVGRSMPAMPFDGMSITGTLMIGGDGLARIVDGRIQAFDRVSARRSSMGVR